MAPIPESALVLDWDGWVSGRAVVTPPVPPAKPVDLPPAPADVPEPLDLPDPLTFAPAPEPVLVVEPEAVVPELFVAELVVDRLPAVPEVVEATVVTFGSRGGLDGAALDAVAALEAPRPSRPPSRRFRRH